MNDTLLIDQLESFLKAYEKQTNTHNFDNVAPLIEDSATYFFSDGTFVGIEEIRKAFNETWQHIQNEEYSIKNLKWIVVSEIVAVCSYEFFWRGIVDGKTRNGRGRGTNVLVRIGDTWKMKHEHLSK